MSTRSQSSASSSATGQATNLGTSISAALSGADSASATKVQNLGLVCQARVTQLQRSAVTITGHFGAGSAQAQAAQADVTAANNNVAKVSLVSQQLSTPTPAVSANGWALQGRVFDANLAPLSGYTVFLVDSQNGFLSSYGFTYTDQTGYFLLNYDADVASQTKDQGAVNSGAPGESTGTDDGPLFVEVADANAEPVYLSPNAFVPALGAATYENITIASGNKPIGDPPGVIRAFALPDQAIPSKSVPKPAAKSARKRTAKKG